MGCGATMGGFLFKNKPFPFVFHSVRSRIDRSMCILNKNKRQSLVQTG